MSKKGKELDEHEIVLISEQSGVEPCVVRSWHKEFLVVCPTGRLDKRHFLKFYKELVVHPCTNLEQIADRVFAAFDNDSNGYLDFDEFLIAYAITSRSEPHKKLEFIFKFYDGDRDGYLTDKEFLVALKRLYKVRNIDQNEHPPLKTVQEVFLKIDGNGDHKLSHEEFISGCMAHTHLIEILSPYEIQ